MKHHTKHSTGTIVILAIVIVVLAGIGYSLIAKEKTQDVPTGKYDAFAKCISEKGAFMYGTEWCPHCQSQKKMFGASFEYVNYVDCDRTANACKNAGVTGYPTWTFGDGTRASGTQMMNILAEKTGCAIE